MDSRSAPTRLSLAACSEPSRTSPCGRASARPGPLLRAPPSRARGSGRRNGLQVEQRNRQGGLTRPQYPWHDQIGGTVHAFRLRRSSTTKATDHELQKYDIFTRYGHWAWGLISSLRAKRSNPDDRSALVGWIASSLCSSQ